MKEDDEYISMIDYAVSWCVREVVCRCVSDEVGIPHLEGRKILMDLLREEKEAPDNIRCWFERVY